MPSSASFPHDLDDRGCGQRRRLHDDDDDDDDEVGETALDDLLQWGGAAQFALVASETSSTILNPRAHKARNTIAKPYRPL